MRVLVAPQEYKGTLTAAEAARVIERALRAAFPGVKTDLRPMADGGPGTASALLAALGGEERACDVHDPLMRPIEASWALLSSGVGVIECAAASGLSLLRAEELDPRAATTFGTGELIRAALDAGCREVIVGLGGSATNDGGAGMAQALGYRLLNDAGDELPAGGAALARLARIDVTNAHPGIVEARFLGATDVTNPLCGPEGASAVYGPQKGADAHAVRELDAALERLARVLSRDLGVDVRGTPGAGAAGGLGAGVIAFLRGELRPGAAIVAEAAGLVERLREADVVVTGEGRLDGQTSFGKAPQYVARQAKALGKPIVCVPGALGPGHERLKPLFDVIEPASPDAPPADREQAEERLSSAVVRALLGLGLGRR